MSVNLSTMYSSKSPFSSKKVSPKKPIDMGKFMSPIKGGEMSKSKSPTKGGENSFLKGFKTSLMELDEMLEHEVQEMSSFISQNRSSECNSRKSPRSIRSNYI